MRLRHKIAASVLLAIPVVVMPASIAHAAEAPADGAKTEASPSGEELDGLDLRVNGGETIHVKEVGECTESAKLKGIVEAKGEEQAKKIEDCFSAASPILPKLSEIVWGGIAWLLVMLVVVKAAVPALKKTMAARSDKIKGDLEAAEAAKSTANAELADYRAKLADAQSEANRIIDEARQSAEGVRKDLVARAEAEAAEVRHRANDEVRLASERAMADLRQQVATMSVDLAGKIVEKNLDVATQQSLIDSYISGVGSN